MGVLPDRSKKIVPEVYHELMTSPNSSIIDFYPRDFELDMDGKKMEWEAVVKIPFIDEKRLLDAMGPKNELLSDDEKARNGFGVPLKFTYSDQVNFTYPSSLPGVFPDITNCRCIENMWDLPDMEGLQYLSGLTNGVMVNGRALAGFPTLHTLPHTAQLVAAYGVNVFQQDSRNPSIVVTLTGTESRSKVETWKAKLGQKCYVGYPFLQEAKVVKVQDELFSYELSDERGDIVSRDHSNREAADWAKEADHLETWHAKRLGITIGEVECLVYVHMLRGLIKTEDGALIKEYAENASLRSTYAAQTIVDEVVNEDERFIERAALPIEEEFPIGTRAFFLGEYAYGRPLEVTGHVDKKAEIVVGALKQKEPEFSYAIIQKAARANPYTPSFAVAKQLGVHPLVLSKITSSYQILSSSGLKLNLGLNLKFEGRKLKVLGYSRKSQTGWEFSNAAIKLIADYMVAFPDFFAAIQREPQKSEVHDTDLWQDPSVASQRVKDISAWLKKQETSKFERVPLEAEQLDSDVVMALAQVGEQVFQASQHTEIKKMRGVPRSALLKPSDAELVLGNQNFVLGDRVTFIAGAGKVPIATRGTVVGISRTATALLLDVVWDTSFMSGTTLGERAPMFRGQTVAASTVLNTSNKQVISASTKSQQRKPARTAGAVGAYASVGVTQLKDAPTPAPLRGGWRGAVNGSHGGSRGREGPKRGAQRGGGPPNLVHSTLVYRNGPGQPQANGANGQPRGGRSGAQGTHAPDTNQQQPLYGNVPPPASLDASRGRGRGRGGRGRGGRGRGGPPRGPS
jgi:5'-3' exoribonuclease 1